MLDERPVGAGDGEGIGGGRFSAFGGTFGSRQVACRTSTIWLWLERFRSMSILPNQSPEAEAFHFAPWCLLLCFWHFANTDLAGWASHSADAARGSATRHRDRDRALSTRRGEGAQ